MVNLPKQHRLRGYDYSRPGFYFITICVHREILSHTPDPLGEIHNKQIVLSAAGQITQQVWDHLPDHFPNLAPDAFCIMPNHIHCTCN